MDACWGAQYSDEQIEETLARNGLLTMELELSNRCNLRCIYCYAQSNDLVQKDELSLTEIQSAVVQAKDLGAHRIIVLGGGEPLLHPQIREVLQFLYDLDLEIELFTNATLIDRQMAAFLAQRRVKPVVKMNSLNPRIQDILAGKKGAAEIIRQGIECLLGAGYPEKGLELGAQTIVCKHNYDELPAMWLYLRTMGIIPYFEILTDQGRACDNPDLQVSTEKIKLLFEDLARIDKNQFGFEWTPKPPIAGFTCRRHLFSCTVTSTGEVFPCPGVNISGDNIRALSLKSILDESQVFQDLRNIHKKIKGNCAECDLNPPCYGCRGAAYQLTGDYLAADPLCWKNCDKEAADKE